MTRRSRLMVGAACWIHGLIRWPTFACLLLAGTTVLTQPAANTAGVPVMHRGVEVYRVFSGFGLMSAEERALRVERRLDRAGRDQSFEPARMVVVDGETATEIHYDDQTIAVVTDADASAAGQARVARAQDILEHLRAAITASRAALSWRSMVRGVLLALLQTALLVAAVWAIWRVRRRLLHATRQRARNRRRTHDPTLHPFDLQPVVSVWSGFVRGASLAIIALLSVVWLSAVLGELPWTQPVAARIFDYAAEPFKAFARSLIDYLPRLFFVLGMVVVTGAIIRLARLVFAQIGNGTLKFETFPADWATPTYKLVRLLLLAIGFVAIFPYIPGARSPAFQGVSIFIGFLVSLSSSSALSNVIAGTILTYTRAFRVGDVVSTGDVQGVVAARSLLVTRVRTFKDVLVTVPNSLVLGGHVLNYSDAARGPGIILHTSVTIGYDRPWRDVHAALLAAARMAECVEAEPVPFVLQTGLNDFYVTYELNAFTRQQALPRCYSQLHQCIQDAFAAANIEILSPHYRSVRDGQAPAIPRPQGTDAGTSPRRESSTVEPAGVPSVSPATIR